MQNQFNGRNKTIGESASSNNQTDLPTWKQRSKANFDSDHLLLVDNWSLDSGGDDRESAQALEAAQNPRMTAKETTATQKLNPKQTHGSEGTIKFCANHLGRDNLKLRAQASARGLPKHSWNRPANNQCSNNRSGAQFHGIEPLSDRKHL